MLPRSLLLNPTYIIFAGGGRFYIQNTHLVTAFIGYTVPF